MRLLLIVLLSLVGCGPLPEMVPEESCECGCEKTECSCAVGECYGPAVAEKPEKKSPVWYEIWANGEKIATVKSLEEMEWHVHGWRIKQTKDQDVWLPVNVPHRIVKRQKTQERLPGFDL